jgi:hypothetical protein
MTENIRYVFCPHPALRASLSRRPGGKGARHFDFFGGLPWWLFAGRILAGLRMRSTFQGRMT